MKNALNLLLMGAVLTIMSLNTTFAQDNFLPEGAYINVTTTYDTLTIDLSFEEINKKNFDKVKDTFQRCLNLIESKQLPYLTMGVKAEKISLKTKKKKSLLITVNNLNISGETDDVLSTMKEEWSAIEESIK